MARFFTQRALNIFILAVALVAGGYLRFEKLGNYQLTSDEGASWGAASLPKVSEVISRGMWVNRGLALHDTILHYWMLTVGDSVVAMRALSAAFGTLAIAMLFLLVRELFDQANGKFFEKTDAESVASLSALIFALNLVAVRQSREARMYALMLAAALAQAWCFVRAVYRGGFGNCTGVWLLTFLTTAASFVVLPLFAAEGLWLCYEYYRKRWWQHGTVRVGGVAAALAAAAFTIAAVFPWHQRPPSFVSWLTWFPGATVYITRKFIAPATLNLLFPATLALFLYGILRAWRCAQDAVVFGLLCMWLPVLLLALWLRAPTESLLIVAYAWTPIFVHRYVLTCIAPFCMLIALGIWEIRYGLARVVVLSLIVLMALLKIDSYRPSDDDLQWGTQWQEASAIAADELKSGRPVNVDLPYSADVVRYYLRAENDLNTSLITSNDPRARLTIISRQAIEMEHRGRQLKVAIAEGYFRIVSQLDRVIVLEREVPATQIQ